MHCIDVAYCYRCCT